MPYKRYDITNTYSYRGKRKNDNVVLKTIFLVVLPIVMVGVIALGGYVSYLVIMKDNPTSMPISPVESNDSEEARYEEELLMVVNENSPLDKDYVPELAEVNGVKVSVLCKSSLEKLLSDSKSQGINLSVSQGYVSHDEQQEKYNRTFEKIKKDGKLSQIRAEAETKKICPPAGCSESQTGLLVTFASSAQEGDFSKTPEFRWLEKHAVEYGFILRYPEGKESDTGISYDPCVFRYVGAESAKNIRRYDMTLEEYSLHISLR